MDTTDVVIIGGGPAGLTAAIYAARSRLATLMIEKMSPGGQVLVTDRVDNYPGFPEGITGFELVDRMAAQARRFGVSEMTAEVTGVEPAADGLVSVSISSGGPVLARGVIIATGASHRKLGVPGEEEYAGRGVSYCATCDGPFFRDQEVAVVGGGDSAVQEAIFLTKFASKVYLIHRRDQLRAVKILQEKAFSNPKIEFVWDSVVEEVLGDDSGVTGVRVANVRDGSTRVLAVTGLFVFIGMVPNTGFLKGVVEMDQRGFILADEWMRTSMTGVYAAGDCRAKPLLQIVTAVSDGATAAFAIEHALSGAG